MRVHQLLCTTKKSLPAGKARIASWFIKASLFLAFMLPLTAHGQEAGCINADTIFVKINTVPPTINATPASFTCNSSYTYQWLVSTDNIHYTVVPGATGQNLNYTLPVTSTLFFLRQAKCGSITMYTNRVVVYPVYTACVDFGLSLAGTSGNALASINAGLVTTTTSSTIGEFVIEWYRSVIDDIPEFVSGSVGATDPAVTVSHPFIGEPAEGGTWHPVIKYVYIDGIKYSRKYVEGVRHSPDLLHCLDPVVVIVNNLSCSNGGSFIDNGVTYAHKVSYRNNINSPTLANRSFSFDLDATNKYFAWRFVGFEIADFIKITYVSPANGNTETVLEYWKIGANAGGTNVNVSPKIYGGYLEWKMTPLTAFTYSAGDYLRIEITAGSIGNSNWDFYCACKPAPPCDAPTGAVRNITQGTVSMTYDSVNCRYEVQYALPNPYAGGYTSDFWRYHNYGSNQAFLGGVDGWETATIRKLQLQKRTDGLYTGISSYTIGSCVAMAGSAQVSKAGNQITLVFTNSADYNSYKTNYNNALVNANISNYTNNPASINYYKFWIIDVSVGNNCGDGLSRYQIWSHLSTPINFNDGSLTITTTLATITNGYVPANSCDFIGQTTADMVNTNNIYTGNIANFSGTTYVRGGIGCYYAFPISRDETDKRFKIWYTIPSADICDLGSKGWNPSGNAAQWEMVFVNDRVHITNPNDALNNFRLERWMNASGVELSNPIIIYEKVNGVVIVNVGFPF